MNMNIDESNLIVKETIYNNMTKSNKYIKNFDEFGYYHYTIFPDTEVEGNITILYNKINNIQVKSASGSKVKILRKFTNIPVSNYSLKTSLTLHMILMLTYSEINSV